jgi:hypothetical protein
VRLWILSGLHVELTRGWDLPSDDARPQFDVLVSIAPARTALRGLTKDEDIGV